MSDHGRNLYEAGLEAGASGTTSTVVLGSQRLALPARVAARVVACQGRKVFAVDPGAPYAPCIQRAVRDLLNDDMVAGRDKTSRLLKLADQLGLICQAAPELLPPIRPG